MGKFLLTSMVALAAVTALSRDVAAQEPAPAGASAPYTSPMRAECEAELAKDKRWQAELGNQMRPEVHQQDASLMMTNKKHVVMAYAALWILVVVFLVLMWMRQQKLTAEIARLERDLKKAAEQ
jgi:hypothetical protein